MLERAMRLIDKEIQAIVEVARKIYGQAVEVYLFGSRVDDTKRGGDIDLLLRNQGKRGGILERVRFLAELKMRIGEQKIDVVGDYEDSPVVREALLTGIRLA